MMKLCCIAILFSAASARTLTRPKSALITPLRWYRVQMATRPALTNCATSALISVASDAVAQSIERRAMRSAAGEGVTASLEQPAADWTALATDAELAAMPSSWRE